jgi:hypothetical protein
MWLHQEAIFMLMILMVTKLNIMPLPPHNRHSTTTNIRPYHTTVMTTTQLPVLWQYTTETEL